MNCINVKQRFGEKYRVDYEESYYAQYGPNARVEDSAYRILLCRNGHICPWGGSNLAACTDRPGRTVNRLKALPFTTVAQDGTDGANVVFDVAHFDEVAEIMRPRKRRRRDLTPEQRAELVERMRQINRERQSHASSGDQAGVISSGVV